MNRKFHALLVISLLTMTSSGFAQSGYQLSNTYHVKSTMGWDYIAVDPTSNKLYASHGTQVNVINKKTGDSLNVIPNTLGVHGIALLPSAGKGFTSNGRANSVTVFDYKTEKTLDTIATGQNPDAIFYEDYTKKIITCNGRSQDLSLIDPATNKVTGTIPVGGKPETAVSDGAGMLFVNIEDKNEIAAVDLKSMKVVQRWSLSPAEGPTGLSIDRATHRLFAGCEKTLVILDATSGKIVTTIPIGDGCDGTAFDPQLKYIFTSNGEGTMSVVQEVSANEYKLLENVPTKRGARTITVDPSTHTLYLPTAEFGPSTGQGRPPLVPGSFQVLVMTKK